jgi:antitoxin VapB
MDRAKIFRHDGSQAVRLPKDYRFDTDEVRVWRHGSAVILEPVPKDWAWLAPLIDPVDADFEKGATEHVDDRDRPELDFFA